MITPIKQRRYIASSGPRYAKVALCGEAPGADEEIKGFGFAGAAGEELNRMLNDAGLLRTDCYVTNVFKFRPTDNDIEEFVCGKKRQPGIDWQLYQGRWVHPDVLSHIDELKHELEILKPNVVVAFGNIALWALCNVDGILKWRGSLLESTLVPGLKVIPVIHPAAILRMWAWRWDAVQDLRRVKDQSLSPQATYPNWLFHVKPSFEEVMQCFSEITRSARAGNMISVDIETTKGKTTRVISCFGIAWSLNEAICIPLQNRDGSSYWTLEEEVAILHAFFGIVTNPKFKIIGQNLLYDVYYFHLFYHAFFRPYIDTLMGFHFLYPGKPKALHEQASLLCKFYRYWKDEGKNVDKHQTDEQVWIYNCQDVVYTLEVAMLQEKLIEKRPSELWDFMRNRWDSAFELSVRGCRIDVAKRQAAREALTKVMDACLSDLQYIFGPGFNPDSPNHLREVFYDDFKLEPILDRKTRKPTVGDDALIELANREPLIKPIVELISRYKTARVTRSTVIDSEGPPDRFFTAFNSMGPETYRWSSSKNAIGLGCNLQNIRRDDPPSVPENKRFPSMRSLFIPDDGYFLFEVDLKSADLQVVVWEADDAELKADLRSGKDVYTDSAQRAGIHMPRQASKMFIHLTDYGGKPRTAAISCKIRVAEAERMQKLWFSRHPGIKRWHDRIEECLNKTRTISNAFGLKITYFDRLDNVLKEALAWIPQTTVANVTDFAIINIRKNLPSVQVLINGHDSIVGQALLTERSTIGPRIKEALQVTIPYKDPLVIPWSLKIGDPSWGEAKSGCWNCMQTKDACTC